MFLLKWGFNPKFFRKHYLKVNETNVYNGPLKQPSKSFSYYKDLLINKLKLVYLKKFN